MRPFTYKNTRSHTQNSIKATKWLKSTNKRKYIPLTLKSTEQLVNEQFAAVDCDRFQRDDQIQQYLYTYIIKCMCVCAGKYVYYKKNVKV